MNNKKINKSKDLKVNYYGGIKGKKSLKEIKLEKPIVALDASNSGMVEDSAAYNLTDSSFPTAMVNPYFNLQFIGYPQLSMYLQDGIAYSILDILATDCTRKGIEIVSLDEDNNLQDKIDIIKTRMKELEANHKIKEAFFWSLAFGGSYIYPKLINDDIEPSELSTELIADRSKITQIEYLQVLDPYYTRATPTGNNYTNPLLKTFYKPEIIYVLTQSVHITRLIRCVPFEAPMLLKPIYNYLGIPLLQMLVPYIDKFLKAFENISELLDRSNLNILKTNMEAILSRGLGIDDLRNRINLFIDTVDAGGVIAIDKETEEWQQITNSLTGIAEVLNQIAQYLCMIPRIPATKLFGQSPKGLNSTGKGEEDNYNVSINSMQENVLRPIYKKIIDMIQIEQFNDIEPNIDFIFLSLENANELEQTQINLNKAQIDTMLTNLGAISNENVAQRIAKDKYSGYNEINLDTSEPFEIDQYQEQDTDKDQ